MTRIVLSTSILVSFSLLSSVGFSKGEEPNYEQDRALIGKMAGCFDVDYSYTEIEALKEGYNLDPRLYDVSENMKLRELIISIEKSDSETRLQHVLFATGPGGQIQLILKHQAEDWEFQPSKSFKFEAPGQWSSNLVFSTSTWNRKVTSLDDGPRYQCVGSWNLELEDPEWKCSGLSPIPGRETRDMGRTDYNVLDRGTRLIHHGESWLERQTNKKVVMASEAEGRAQTALAKEKGKIWYVRTQDSECSAAQQWADVRMPFWKVLMEEWEIVYSGSVQLVENPEMNSKVRMGKIAAIEASFLQSEGKGSEALNVARSAIKAVLASAFLP